MENFAVKLSGLSQGIEEEQKIEGQLSALESDIRSVRNGLGFQIKGRADLQNTLKRLADDVNHHESDMKQLRRTLAEVHDEYEKTERRICGYVNDHPITKEDVQEAITTVGKGYAISALFGPVVGTGWLIHEILKDEDWEIKYDVPSYERKIWDKWGGDKKDEKDNLWKLKKEYYISKKAEEKDRLKKEREANKSEEEKQKDKERKKKTDILESVTIWSGSMKKEGSLLHFGKDGDVETDWGNYSYSADFMKVEASASAKITGGGMKAEIGVAISALTAEAAGQLGDDMLGLHGKVGVEVGKAEAKGSVGMGIWDENGNFDPKLSTKLSAEAIAAEVSGTVGVDLAGVKVDAKGSLNFGIGAHADIGYQNGKFSFDLGASLGVGASIKFDVDISGAVEYVGNAAADIANAAGNFVSDIGKGADKIGKGFQNGWKTVTGWFK